MHSKLRAMMFVTLALGLGGCSNAEPIGGSPSPPATQTEAQAQAAATPVEVASASDKEETATFAGGCFWAMQTEFEKLKGVKKVTAGFSGGSMPNPSYEQVSTGTTGHAETVQIVFDPSQISYQELVRIFLTDIDPTTKDRQGNDTGTQYRSAIFYHGDAQKATAQKVIAEIDKSKLYSSPIVTEVDPYKAFYAAEAYHQNYFDSHSSEPYCSMVVGPEVKRFVQKNKEKLK